MKEPEFIQIYIKHGGAPRQISEESGIAERNVRDRIKRMREDGRLPEVTPFKWAYPRTRVFTIPDLVGIVFSDSHWWPGHVTIAHRALVVLTRELQPGLIAANGDLIDGTKISRFPPSGWSTSPSVTEELGETQTRLAEISKAAPSDAIKVRTIGNHDLRFDRLLASQANSMDGLHGTKFEHHVPAWNGSWSLRVNDTIIKHRLGGGEHAVYTNAMKAGVSIVTGHLHRLCAKPLRGYRDGHIWGVESGTLADCPSDTPDEGSGPFEYVEDSPTNWSSGFAVLTWRNGHLMVPEFCMVERGIAWFRGAEVKV